MIVLNDEHYAAMVNAAQQVKARGARLIVITDEATPNLTTLADDVSILLRNALNLTTVCLSVGLNLTTVSLCMMDYVLWCRLWLFLRMAH